jgi:hypothetical protein
VTATACWLPTHCDAHLQRPAATSSTCSQSMTNKTFTQTRWTLLESVMNARMRGCMYGCLCVRAYVCACACACGYQHVYVCGVCACVSLPLSPCVCVCVVRACVHACMDADVRAWTCWHVPHSAHRSTVGRGLRCCIPGTMAQADEEAAQHCLQSGGLQPRAAPPQASPGTSRLLCSLSTLHTRCESHPSKF